MISVSCPGPRAEDGDPLDVLLLMDEPAFPGCAVRARLVGVIEGQQLDGKNKIRNDRILAVAEANHMYTSIRRLKDLPTQFLHELEDFFVNYHDLEGKKYHCWVVKELRPHSISSSRPEMRFKVCRSRS